jgi:anti-sigma factor RsiW
VHLREEQLIAYLDGEADETVKQHLRACEACAARLEAYSVLQSILLRAPYRRRCPGSQTLGDFHLGLLTEVEASAIRKHLIECPHCAAELEALKQFLTDPEISANGRFGGVPGPCGL